MSYISPVMCGPRRWGQPMFCALVDAASGIVSGLIGPRFGSVVVSCGEDQDRLGEGCGVECKREVALPSEPLELGLGQPVSDFLTGGEDRSVRFLAIQVEGRDLRWGKRPQAVGYLVDYVYLAGRLADSVPKALPDRFKRTEDLRLGV